MKKLVKLLFVIISICISQLYSISVTEYIQQEGTPQVINGILDLAHKNLTSLEGFQSISAEVLNQARILKLSVNQLQMVPNGIFNGLNNLEHLYLDSNQLAELHAGAFSGLHNLQILILADNQLQNMPATIFNNLSNLKVLILNANQLRKLPLGIFNGLRNLETLSLSSNQLQELPVGIFSDLHKLETLDLSNNQLRALQPGIFSDLNSLTILSMSSNPFSGDFIASLPSILRGIPTLKYLNGKPVDEALKAYKVYNPKALRESTIEYLMQNLTPEQLEELALTEHPAFELLPLTPQQRAAIIAKNINAFRHKLHELPSEILDLLLRLPSLTPAQKAGIAAQKRRMDQ